ncbi:MAG TPA: IS4 family transposase [Ferruginibacter sp.]|nr:IS4 family transposase [Ferruginibacter sp.]
MSKSTFFTGQPIFNQILNFIPRSSVQAIVRELEADKYYKSFKTYEHLVTMLYSIFNHCTSLREVTTGLLAWDRRIHHLGMDFHPRRSTISDANRDRSHEVFEKIYFKILERYRNILPDSRKRSRKNNLYIFDSTSITLFQEILKGAGKSPADGRRKGGIKVHTLLNANLDVPTMIRYSAAADNDSKFLKEVQLAKGSVIVFDKGYRDYSTFNRFSEQRITWVTRLSEGLIYTTKERNVVNDYQKQNGIKKDWVIELGHNHHNKATKVPGRLIKYYDAVNRRYFEFITNNLTLAPLTIANYYQQRWQIETFFKRIKQNYPLQYFLGDNENAIKIQIWCTLIADLLLKVIKKGTNTKMAFSNIAGLVRLHLMTYMDLKSFLRSPEKALLRKVREDKQQLINPSLFPP